MNSYVQGVESFRNVCHSISSGSRALGQRDLIVNHRRQRDSGRYRVLGEGQTRIYSQHKQTSYAD